MNFDITPEWLKGKLAKADDGCAAAGIPLRSCFVCGQTTLPERVAVRHAIYPEIVCCQRCWDAADAAKHLPTNGSPLTERGHMHFDSPGDPPEVKP